MAVKLPLPLIITVTLLSFLFLFTSAYARTSSALPEDEVTISNTLTDLPESDPKSTETIILPSEKSTVEFQPKTGSGFGSIEATEDTGIESAQLQFISFRPINRHFPRRPFHPFRYGKPCRHHHRRHPYRLKPWDPSFNGREISYGNDMILSGAEDVDSVPDPVSQGAVRQIPATWAQFRHGEPKYALMHDVERTKEMKRPYHDLHHHHHKRHVEEEEEETEEDDERKEKKHEHKDGLVKLFRKFSHHF